MADARATAEQVEQVAEERGSDEAMFEVPLSRLVELREDAARALHAEQEVERLRGALDRIGHEIHVAVYAEKRRPNGLESGLVKIADAALSHQPEEET